MALDDKAVEIVLDERDLPTPPAPPLHPGGGLGWPLATRAVKLGLAGRPRPPPPPPPLHPGTGQPLGPADLAPLFPMALIMQEVSTEREIAIPEEVRAVYRQWRPTPLFRARRLEKALGTPAKIYY